MTGCQADMSAAVLGRGGEAGGGRFRAILNTLDLAFRLARRMQINAKLRQRGSREQRDQASQHFKQRLHGGDNDRTRLGLQ